MFDKKMNWTKINKIIFLKYFEGKIQLNETKITALAKGKSDQDILLLIQTMLEAHRKRK